MSTRAGVDKIQRRVCQNTPIDNPSTHVNPPSQHEWEGWILLWRENRHPISRHAGDNVMQVM